MADRILAIDPGTTHSGCVLLIDNRVAISRSDWENENVIRFISEFGPLFVAIEQIRSYGPDVWAGNETHDTSHWAGRFHQRALDSGGEVMLIPRSEAKLFLTGSVRTKDPQIRGALIDLFGGASVARGTKKNPGPLYKVSGHAWAALAIAATARHKQEIQEKESAK